MKWPWNHYGDNTGGNKAREEAEVHLQKTRERWPEVRRVSGSLRDLREKNHFAEAIEEAMRGRRA